MQRLELSPDDWLQLDGLLTNILRGRFTLKRKGDEVELTEDEMRAILNFKTERTK